MTETTASEQIDAWTAYQTNRWNNRDVRVFAAMDTMDQIAEHVLGIVGEGRIMNKIATYVHSDGLDDLSRLDHATGLHKGGHAGYPQGHHTWSKAGEQAGFSVYLTHGYGTLGTMEGFGVGVMDHDAPTERKVRDRHDRAMAAKKAEAEAKKAGEKFDHAKFGYAELREVTYIEMHGRPGQPHRDDRIEIMDWNQYGVLRHTIITFVEPDWCNSGRVTETNYVVVGYLKDPTDTDGSKRYSRREEDAAVFARIDGPDADLDAAKTALREVQARPETDFVWLAEEKVTRERHSI